MNINKKLIHIPPHISTSWFNVSALHVESKAETSVLVVMLADGGKIEIPDLSKETLDHIFSCHEAFLEEETEESEQNIADGDLSHIIQGTFDQLSGLLGPSANFFGEQGSGDSAAFPAGGFEALGPMLQHNPNDSQAPDLPEEMLSQIQKVARVLMEDEQAVVPVAEANCNCMHCQIARAMRSAMGIEEDTSETESEEVVSDDELRFREWDINELGEKLYQVTNPLSNEESYKVFLGEPLGCTCGQSNCEHIKAVLRS